MWKWFQRRKQTQGKKVLYTIRVSEGLDDTIKGFALQKGIPATEIITLFIKLGIILIDSDNRCREATVIIKEYGFDGTSIEGPEMSLIDED